MCLLVDFLKFPVVILTFLWCFSLIQEPSECLRVKRQNSRGRPRLNITKILLETEQRINNRTFSNTTPTKPEVATCGGIYTSSQFLIETPNYPNNHPPNLSCLYILKGPQCPSNFTLQFLDFDLENSTSCINDYLEIRNERICGFQEGIREYPTINGAFRLVLKTNNQENTRGFRILVSRSLCAIQTGITPQPEVPTSFPSRGFTPNESPYIMTSVPSSGYLPPRSKPPQNVAYPNGKNRACCANTYSAKRFFLASPNFPQKDSINEECTFTIYKANENVCRLRLHLHYFLVGAQSPGCPNGYLQIDGKLLCGCHTGLKLVSPFDGHFGNTKVFRYLGSPPGGQGTTGFVLEVIQDECPKRYEPEDEHHILPRFNFYQDQFNRVHFPNITHEELAVDTEVFEPVDLGFRPRVVKHVYVFGTPDVTYDFGDVTVNKPRDVEETTYVETTDLNGFYPSGDDFQKCTSWGVYEWNQLRRNIFWQRMPQCSDISMTSYEPNLGQGQEGSTCKDYSFLKGYFQSPGYPYYYPKNINICYRFYKQRGYCKIRLIMLDFQLENSFDCMKDYLYLNNNFRYCGQSLANTFTLFDMNGKSYEEIKFVTNGETSGRGFRGIYEQIPCSDSQPSYQTTLPPPPIPTPPPFVTLRPPTTTRPMNGPCLRNIKDDYFTIDIYDYGKDSCNFNVFKTKQNICKLELTFVTFDFPCGLEYLEIRNKQYCGNFSGQMVTIRYENQEQMIPILYKRISFKPGMGSGLKLHLVGRQSSSDCVELPPAQRISEQQIQLTVQPLVTTTAPNDFPPDHGFPTLTDNKINGQNHSDQKTNGSKTMEIINNRDDVSVILTKKYPEVCGIVLNMKETPNPSSCNIILNNQQVDGNSTRIDCNPITDNTIYVPYKDATDRLELKFKDVAIVQEIEFKEITCDNKFVV